MHVEVFGNPLTGDTEARELQIFGTLPGISAESLNQPPTVNAGSAQTITLPSSATLNGTADDDGLPVGGVLTTAWSKLSGPGTVTFGNPTARSTTGSFSAAGTYALRLTANDTALSATSDVTINVAPQAAPELNQAPTVNAGAAQTITLPSPATLSGIAADDGVPAAKPIGPENQLRRLRFQPRLLRLHLWFGAGKGIDRNGPSPDGAARHGRDVHEIYHADRHVGPHAVR